jgi:hypothetical protein
MNQDKEVRIEPEELRRAMGAEIEQLVKETADALNNARDGAIIADSEWIVREAIARFRQKVFEKAVQMKADKAAKAAFSPRRSDKGTLPRDKGIQGVNHLTANDTIRIQRRVYWHAGEGTDNRVDRWLGIADSSLSLAARELCCLVGVDNGFRKAAGRLKKLGQIEVSPERLRTVVEAEGVKMLEARRQALLKPDWDASDCTVDASGKTQVLTGGDGVMVPVITAAEKAKRRAGFRHVRRRGNKHRRVRRHRGADQGWKEFKIGTFYSADKEHCCAFATRGNHEEFGRQLRREAFKVSLHKADQKFSVTDGAEWLRRQMRTRLPMLDEMILDFYHLAEHVAGTSAACWGLSSAEAQAWTGKVLHRAKHEGALAVLEEIAAARSSVRAKAKREALWGLDQYVAKRVEMMDYPKFITAGFDIGSGPTEAKCKTVPSRLKGSGMRWNLPNAEAMAALACVEQSNMLSNYWSLQRQRVT